ncbi:MAG: LPP20 family lipoprotein [Deferribacteraceae bacterium]|jgi:hypothetical protein|nr:LPP20 family lipoprotein [Deferribacteraceae bacterium]
MRYLLVAILSVYLIGCAAKPSSTVVDREARNAATQAKMEAAIAEMEQGLGISQKPASESPEPETLENKPSPNRVSNKPISGVSKYPMKDGLPVWFSNPSYDGYLGGVGIAKPQIGGMAIQRRVATTLAQADLIRSVKVMVSNEFSSERTLASGNYVEKFETMSRQEADEYIKNPQVQDEWLDPETKELYIWVTLPK